MSKSDGWIPPAGYNPISAIRESMFLWIPVPFFGIPIFCKLMCLNEVQLKTCGDLTCFSFDEKKQFTKDDMINILNIQEKICDLTLAYPKYDEICDMILSENINLKNKKDELRIIEKKIEEIEKIIKNEKNNQKRNDYIEELKEIMNKYTIISEQIGFLIPTDTMSFLTGWALGIDVTDIKKVTREMLLNAAILAKNGKNNPSDHLSGIFTDFQRSDINSNAWNIYNEFQKNKKTEKELIRVGGR